MKLKKGLLILSLGLLLAAADVGPEGPLMKPEFNREEHTILLKVTVYEDHLQVTAAKKRLFPSDRLEYLLGWATWSESGKEPACELHVAKADSYMDKEFAVWGHELAHCLYGNYHKELDGKTK